MTDLERIAELKKAPTYPANIEDFGIVKIYKDDFNWLIEQAEKVEELRKMNWALNQEIGGYSNYVSEIAELNGKLAEQAKRLAKKMMGE